MERVQRWREPAVVVVVVVLVLRLGLAVAFALAASRLGLDRPTDAAYLASRQLSEPVTYVVLAALVLACHRGVATPHARTLSVVAVAAAGLSLVLALGLAGFGYAGYSPPFSQLDLLDRLVGLVVPLLALGVLAALARRSGPPVATEPSGPRAAVAPVEEEAAPDTGRHPTYQPDVAAGAVWTTAGDAASGRPASSWGTGQGAAGGWAPPRAEPAQAPREDPSDQDDQRPEADEVHDWARPRP